MLILKRTIASLIDLVFLIACFLGIYPFLLYLKIELEYRVILLVIFTIVFFIPILYFGTTVGFKIVRLVVISKKRQFFKYIIYYIIISGLIAVYSSILGRLTNIFISNIYSETVFNISLPVALLVISILLFVFSLGKYNLLDYVLNIQIFGSIFKYKPIVSLLTWLSLCYSLLYLSLTFNSTHLKEYFENIYSVNSDYSVASYYPKEEFEDFSFFQIEKIEQNNSILSFSVGESFFQDRYLRQKTIYSLINKSTFEDLNKRYLLARKLIVYSILNNLFNNPFDRIEQTKLVLVYNEFHTYFSNKTYFFTYYYDNLNTKYDIYGGVDLDSLIASQKNQIGVPEKAYSKALAETLQISEDSLSRIKYKEKSISLSPDQFAHFKTSFNKFIISNSQMVLTIIPFNKVEPSVILSLSFPQKYLLNIDYNTVNLWDEKLDEAIVYRDFNFYN